MTRYLSFWKAPRSCGTAITYGLYNGLREQGLSCEYQNEPLHWRRLEPFQDDPDGFAEYFGRTDGSQDIDGVDVVVQKRNAKWIYDVRHGHRFESLRWIRNLENVFLIRNLEDMIRDHKAGLERATAPETPDELTAEVSGIPQLFWLHRYCKDTSIDAPVVSADDLLKDPEDGMRRLSGMFDVTFHPRMVEWGDVDLQTPPWGAEWNVSFSKSGRLRQPEAEAKEIKEVGPLHKYVLKVSE